jgi:hypothetical protein
MIVRKWLSYVVMGIGSLMIVFWLFLLCWWFPYILLPVGILMVIIGRSLRKRQGLAFRLLAHFMTSPHYQATDAYANNRHDNFLPCCNILKIDKGNGRQKNTGEQKYDNECNDQVSKQFDGTFQATHSTVIRKIVTLWRRRNQPRYSRTKQIEH